MISLYFQDRFYIFAIGESIFVFIYPGDGKRWENRNLPGGVGIPEKKPWSWESTERERLNLVFQVH